MRVFIAIELPEDIREGLAEVQRELRPVTNSARWVATESAHLTLKFLGEITEQRAEEVHQAMTGLTWKPFQITVKGVGFFPGARSPRVFWAGLHAPTLEALAERIDSRMETFGFEKERSAPFARTSLSPAPSTDRLDAALVTAASQFEEHEFGTFNVDRCFLYQSELTSSGPGVHEAEGVSALMTMPVAIIGAGGWGTALAVTLARADRRVSLWVYEPDLAAGMSESRENPVYLPSIRIPESVHISNSMSAVLADSRIVIMAVPSHVFRSVVQQMAPLVQPDTIFVSATKGIETRTLMRMSQVIADVLGTSVESRIAVISGPTFAPEVARGVPDRAGGRFAAGIAARAASE